MKRLILLSLFFCCRIYAFSQGWSVEYSFGYGTYKLREVKNIQNSLQQNMRTYGAQNTETFPGWFTHTGTIGYIANRNHLGINFSYLTTGGRTGVTDYSGSYYANITMNGYRLGTFYRYYMNTDLPALDLYLQPSPGVMFSEMKITESINIGTESDSNTVKMKSTAAYIELTAGAMYHITDWLSVSIGGGYQVDFWGRLKNEYGDKSNLMIQWNGLRVYTGLLLTLPSNH